MSGNTFGNIFRVTTFGESHGPAMGAVIDGCPAGLDFDFELVKQMLQRRRPGQSKLTTSRSESESFEVLSGVFEGKTLGTPIAIMVRNEDQRSGDYTGLKDLYRPSHADFTYDAKYGHRDHRGGGRQSARETVARVLAGSVAMMLLRSHGIGIHAWVSGIHVLEMNYEPAAEEILGAEENLVRCPDQKLAKQMEAAIEEAATEGDSLGGVISARVTGMPAGLGEPVFDKLNAVLASAMMGINAVKGFEMGSGFAGARKKGSEQNDLFAKENDKVITRTNNSGGVQGGISNGSDLSFRVAFKPVATIRKDQETLSVGHEPVIFSGTGRHDPCVVPRAVPIVEAMAALVLADMLLRNRSARMQPFG